MRYFLRKCILLWNYWRYFGSISDFLYESVYHFGLRRFTRCLDSLFILVAECFSGVEGVALWVKIKVDDEGSVVAHLNRIKE